jgi:hypothetical protein
VLEGGIEERKASSSGTEEMRVGVLLWKVESYDEASEGYELNGAY